MPHLVVHAREEDLDGREAELITALTEAVVAVYGEWAREIVNVQLIGIPGRRWGIAGRAPEAPTTAISLGVRQALFDRPDTEQLVRGLIAAVTDAVAAVFGAPARPRVTVELIATPPGRTGVAGVLAG